MELTNQASAAEQAGAFPGMDEDFVGPTVRCVLFQLDSEIYGVNVKRIKEVLRVSTIRPVPGTEEQVLGVINVRGVIVTILDLRRFFGIQPKEHDDLSRIIILELDEDKMVGILVDSVMEVKDIPEDKFDTVTAGKETNRVAGRHIQAIAHYNDNVVILIDIDSMFEEVD